MVNTTVIKGLDGVKSYLDGVERAVRFKGKTTAWNVAQILKKNIKNTINTQAEYYGRYHRVTGTGLAESIKITRLKKNLFSIAPDESLPTITSEGGNDIEPPAEYAGYVEFGTSNARPKGYFRKGMNASRNEINKKVNELGDKIIRG